MANFTKNIKCKVNEFHVHSNYTVWLLTYINESVIFNWRLVIKQAVELDLIELINYTQNKNKIYENYYRLSIQPGCELRVP